MIKRNNPGNIRAFIDTAGNYSKPFYGELTPDIKPGKTAGFRVFENLPTGYRALFRLLKTGYIDKGNDTIRKIIPIYAPAGDNNDPSHYINLVEAKTNIPRDRKLKTYADLIPIVKAITEVEHGESANDTDVQSGYDTIFNPSAILGTITGDLLPTESSNPQKKNKYVKPVLIGAGILATFLIIRHYANKPRKQKFNFSR